MKAEVFALLDTNILGGKKATGRHGLDLWQILVLGVDYDRLEHHGLNRCLDVVLDGYQRYVGYGVLSYNLHVIGRELQARARRRAAAERAAA